jgi:Tfp pilus assembly PilM family ATPase
VAVTAYAKKLIEGYYSACIGADLLPLSFEIEAAAMARSVIPADVAGATMMVDFGKTRTGIGIVYQGVLLYTSTIDIGGQDLSTAMREVLGADTAESELTRLKNSIGLMGEASDKALSKTLRVQIDNIINELKTRLTYWHQRTDAHDDRRVSQIIVCGGSANLAGLSGYLTAELKVQSWVSNVWEHVLSLDHTIPPIDRAHSLGYASAVGLALHGGVTNMRV